MCPKYCTIIYFVPYCIVYRLISICRCQNTPYSTISKYNRNAALPSLLNYDASGVVASHSWYEYSWLLGHRAPNETKLEINEIPEYCYSPHNPDTPPLFRIVPIDMTTYSTVSLQPRTSASSAQEVSLSIESETESTRWRTVICCTHLGNVHHEYKGTLVACRCTKTP